MENIETPRLILRPLTYGDRDVIVRLLNDFDVSRWLTVVPYPYTADDFDTFLQYLKAGSVLEGLAIQAEDGVIGVIGIGKTLGYWLGKPFHGKGYMTEAATALIDWYFETSGARVLRSGYFKCNAGSHGVLKKLGFQPTGRVLTEHSQAQGRDVPLIKVSLNRADWGH